MRVGLGTRCKDVDHRYESAEELVNTPLQTGVGRSVRVSAAAFDDAIRVATKAGKPEQIARYDLILLLVQLRLAETDRLSRTNWRATVAHHPSQDSPLVPSSCLESVEA